MLDICPGWTLSVPQSSQFFLELCSWKMEQLLSRDKYLNIFPQVPVVRVPWCILPVRMILELWQIQYPTKVKGKKDMFYLNK